MYSNIISIMEDIKARGIPYAWHHFAEGESPGPPFVVYLVDASDNFGADNIVYVPISVINIELYTAYKDPASEKIIQDVLREHEIFWQSSEYWIDTDRLHMVTYTFELEMEMN